MIYGYIRTSRAAVDGLAGMHPETQLQALADAGVDPVNIVSDVGISGSVPAGERPGWTGLDARLLRGDTLTVAALDRISLDARLLRGDTLTVAALDRISLDARLLRGDTLTIAALDRISRNRVELVAAVESLHQRGVGIASLAPAESWLHALVPRQPYLPVGVNSFAGSPPRPGRVAGQRCRPPLVHVQVRATDTRGSDLHDAIVGVLQLRVWHIFRGDNEWGPVNNCFHNKPLLGLQGSSIVGSRSFMRPPSRLASPV